MSRSLSVHQSINSDKYEYAIHAISLPVQYKVKHFMGIHKPTTLERADVLFLFRRFSTIAPLIPYSAVTTSYVFFS